MFAPQLLVPIQQPLLVECTCHPYLRIVLVIKAQLGTCLISEHARLVSLSNDKGEGGF